MSDRRIIVTQGEQAVSDAPDVVISTLLGSCVTCCLWDPLSGVGGMNHMLVTSLTERNATCDALGVNAMELLINEIQKHGGNRGRLRAKAFGGATMRSRMGMIGESNCAFLLDFLKRERIPCEGQSLGGRTARHLLFWPAKGVARMRFVRDCRLRRCVGQTPPPAGGQRDGVVLVAS